MVNVENTNAKISILNIAKLVNVPFYRAFTPENIKKGFQKSGIYPFNKLAFSESDFVSFEEVGDDRQNDISMSNIEEPQPSTSKNVSGKIAPSALTPDILRPLKKVTFKRKLNGRKGKSRFYTSTPEKTRIELLAAAREKKRKIKIKENLDKIQVMRNQTNLNPSIMETPIWTLATLTQSKTSFYCAIATC